ncbi:MAG: hypothetical protein V8Q75_06340 [Bacilli bacterium]
MKLEVGMYVRTDKGLIGKITFIQNEYARTDKFIFDKDKLERCSLFKENILKARHIIMKLIEEGDYVNGYKVFKKDGYLWIERLDNHVTPHFTRLDYLDIKSIVTKEQFESMSYKVGD